MSNKGVDPTTTITMSSMPKAANVRHFQGRDGLVKFLEDNYVFSNRVGHRTLRSEMYREYKKYCNQNGYPLASIVNIGMYLGQLGM